MSCSGKTMQRLLAGRHMSQRARRPPDDASERSSISPSAVLIGEERVHYGGDLPGLRRRQA